MLTSDFLSSLTSCGGIPSPSTDPNPWGCSGALAGFPWHPCSPLGMGALAGTGLNPGFPMGTCSQHRELGMSQAKRSDADLGKHLREGTGKVPRGTGGWQGGCWGCHRLLRVRETSGCSGVWWGEVGENGSPVPRSRTAWCLTASATRSANPCVPVCHRSPQVLPARAARAPHDVRAVRGVDPGLQVSLGHPPAPPWHRGGQPGSPCMVWVVSGTAHSVWGVSSGL